MIACLAAAGSILGLPLMLDATRHACIHATARGGRSHAGIGLNVDRDFDSAEGAQVEAVGAGAVRKFCEREAAGHDDVTGA